MSRYECIRPTKCDDLPCKGHRVTKAIDQAARVLAWADGWDVMEESDQTADYWANAALALDEIGKPVPGCES